MDYSVTELLEHFNKVKEPFFTHRRFKHADVENLIRNSKLESELVGNSHEGRSISMMRWGSGPTRLLLWSQMHGNEATATMALFDLCKFLEGDGLTHLENKISIYMVPMLNPDGAERFIRRTAQGIDMNRDARSLATPEGKLLKKLHVELNPHFSFNLHDQDTRYAAGPGGKQVKMAFLATAQDETRSWTPNRMASMQVICAIKDALEQLIPGQIARFSDEYEPRAFGDNIQEWGHSLILVESGGSHPDREKMALRELNFLSLMVAFQKIANTSYTKHSLKEYEAIPLNTKSIFDLKIKSVRYKNTLVDLGINLEEINNKEATHFSLKSNLVDLGDLSTFTGLEEIEAQGLEVEQVEELSLEAPVTINLLRNGILKYAIKDGQLAIP